MKLSQALDNNHIVSSRSQSSLHSLLLSSHWQRQLWTPEEDDKLIEFKRNYPIDLGQVPQIWHGWTRVIRPGINKENFSEEEDDIIIRIQRTKRRNEWAFMAEEYLKGRTANAIKNRWNNHLNKMLTNISDVGRYLLTDDETSDHSAREDEDDVASVVAEYASLI
ncbi:hypothetical protein AAG906_016516 [Vitis piasezkii]